MSDRALPTPPATPAPGAVEALTKSTSQISSGAAEALVDPVFYSTPATSQDESDLSAGSTGASAASAPSVIVIKSRYIIGWPEKVEGTIAAEGGEDVDLLPLDVVLSTDFFADHHFTQYATERRIRLNTEAIGHIAIDMVALVLDVDDREVHKLSGEARDAWRASEQPKIDKLLSEQPGIFMYETSGGYRLVGVLEKQLPITDDKQREAWSTYYKECVAEVAQRYDIHADKLSDFTRSFRAPFVMRDGDRQQPQIYCGASPLVTPWQLTAKYQGSKKASPTNGTPTVTVVTEVRARTEEERLAAVEEELTKLLNGRYGDMLRGLLDGQPMVEDGIRHTAMLRVAGVLTSAAPSATVDDIIELLTPSLKATEALAPVKEPAAHHMRGILSTSMASAALRRQVEAERKARDKIEWTRWRQMFERNRPTRPLAEILEVEPDEVHRRLVLHHAGAYYVMISPGCYATPVPRVQMDSSFREWIPRWFPMATKYWTQSGVEKDITIDKLLRDNSTSATNIRISLVEHETRFDAESLTIIEAPLKRRDLKAEYNPYIHQWLIHLGGPDNGKLLDWLATSDVLERPSAALYLTGTPSSGKTMLAAGLARRYHEGPPTPISDALGDWNGAILTCPLVLADEELPSKFGQKTTSESLRAFITADGQTIKRKFLPNVPMSGSLRLVIATNNEKLLDFDELMTEHDAQAIAARFIWIRVSQAPVDYLASIGGRSGGTSDWVDGDGIIKHVLWLAENREVKPGSRFIVEGEIGALRHRIVTRTRMAGLMCEWLVGYMKNPALCPEIVKAGDVIFGDGVVLVRAGAIADKWEKYVKSDKPRSVSMISRVLSSWNSEHYTMPGTTRKYRIVDGQILVRWAEENMPEVVHDLELKLTNARITPSTLVKESMTVLPGGVSDVDDKKKSS